MNPFRTEEARRSPLVSIWGAEGRRKTGLAAQFPHPQYWFVFDPGTDPTVTALLGKGVLTQEPAGYSRYLLPPEEDSDPQKDTRFAKSLYAEFKKDFDWIKSQPDEGTIVFDTETQFKNLVIRAFLLDNATYMTDKSGRPMLMRTAYEKPNQMYEGIIDWLAFHRPKTSVVLISRAGPKYDEAGRETEILIPLRHRRLAYLVDIDLFLDRRLVKGANDKKFRPVYSATVKKSRWDDSLLEWEITDPTYADIQELLP